MIDGLQYIDFNYDILFYEIAMIGYISKGVYVYKDIIKLDYKNYEKLINQVIKMNEDIIKKMEKPDA